VRPGGFPELSLNYEKLLRVYEDLAPRRVQIPKHRMQK
jgi:hypothetical protein